MRLNYLNHVRFEDLRQAVGRERVPRTLSDARELFASGAVTREAFRQRSWSTTQRVRRRAGSLKAAAIDWGAGCEELSDYEQVG